MRRTFVLNILIIIFLEILCLNGAAQVNGINTINPGGINFPGNPGGVAGKNYTSFTNAISALTSYGISGAVTFKAAAGTYYEHISIGAVTGVSAAKSITFQSSALDSTAVLITYSATGVADNWTVKLSGSHYVTFRNITIKAQGSVYGYAVEIDNNSDSNNFISDIIQTTTSTSSTFIPVHSDMSLNQYNTISNNLITGGYYGIYLYGNSTTSLDRGNAIESNTIKDFYYYGIFTYYQDAIKIRKNYIQNSASSLNITGLSANYCNNAIEITGNNLVLNATLGGYGLYLGYDAGTVIYTGKIANNFISLGSASGTSLNGIYLSYSSYQNLSFNSVNLYAASALGEDIYITGGTAASINLKDNIFANFSGGYAISLGTTATLAASNYNDLYTTGSFVGYWTSAVMTLASWRAVSGKDLNSVSANPGFYTQTDLHVNTVALSNTGTPVAGIVDDIDGDARSVTPDIGADEFSLAYNDAGCTVLVSPLPPSAGVNTIKIKIKNYGISVLNSVVINWQINGITKIPKSKSSLGLPQYQETVVTIDTFSFKPSTSYNLKFWTTLPNGVTDQNTRNDAFTFKNLKTGMNGTFTIGAVSSDYINFNAAVDDLINSGVCSPVIFRVKAGSYNENVNIPAIMGTSSVNTITFISYNLDSTSVDLNYSASGVTDNYVIQLNGSSYVTFKLMKIRALGTNYGRVVILTGGANYNTVSNNIITTFPAASTSYCSGIYDDNSSLDNYNTIKNNIIDGGFYGIYLYGINSAARENYNVIQNNIIKDFYEYGIMAYYQNSPLITGNTIENYNGVNVTNYGIYTYFNYDTIKITKNKIFINGISTNYGIYDYNNTSTASTYALIANNFISVYGTSANYNYGIYEYSSTYQNILFNSINISTPSGASGYSLYSGSGSFITLKDNIFANFGQGYSIYINSSTAITASDYNDLYTNGSVLGFWTTSRTNLSVWKIGSGQDAHSVSADPFFVSNTDLHVYSRALDSAAQYSPLVKNDIDNEPRNIYKPDIGADEFTLFHRDGSIISMLSPVPPCAGVSGNVIVKFRNYGIDTIKTTKIKWSVNGTFMTPLSFSGKLPSLKDTSIKVGTFTFNAGINYNIKFWADSINGAPDQYHKNDTFSQIGLHTALAGIYTIGTGKNYATFNAAVNDLKTFGICSPVTFIADTGTYNEQVNIPSILGSSDINTITFKSTSNDSNLTVIKYAAVSSSDNFVVQLDGANYIRFQKIKMLSASTSGYGYVVVLKNNASYNIFMNNVIQSINSTMSMNAGVYFYSNTLSSYNVIVNNRILNGFYGFLLYGNSPTSLAKGNVVKGNIVNGFYYYGMMIYYQDSIEINKNTFTGNTNNAVLNYGIYCYYCNNSSKIINNKIVLNSTTTLYGIYMNYSTGSNISRLLIANNFISLTGSSTGNVYGIYSYYGYYQKIYYNSIYLSCTTSSINSALYFSSPTTGSYGMLSVQNNIACNNGTGYAIYIDANAVTLSYVNNCNFNDLFVNGTYLGHYGSTDLNNLSSWQKTSGKDVNSFSLLPSFVSSTDLHLTIYNNCRINNPLLDVATDIDGDPRSPVKPVAGADENPCFPVNAGILGIVSPQKVSCDGILPVTADLYDFGTSNLDSVYIDYFRNGIKIKSIKFSGHLSYLNYVPVFICYDTFTAGKFYNVVVRTRLPNGIIDPYPRDDADSAFNIRLFPQPVITSVSNDTICYNKPATLKVTSKNSNIFTWYDSVTAGNLLAQDSFYVTNNLASNRTYYVSASTPGYPYNLMTTKNSSAYEMGNMFNIKASGQDVVVDSFGVIANAIPGTPVPIALYYKTGTYKGYEKNPSAWTLVGIDTVLAGGITTFTNVPLGHIKIKKGDSAAFYLSSADPGTLLNYLDGANTYADANIKITTGTKNFYPFDVFYLPNKTWDGIVYYSMGSLCVSARTPVFTVVMPMPKLDLGPDSTFCKGQKVLLNAGAGIGYFYAWKYGSKTDTISTNQTITVDSSGKYKVYLSDRCGNLLKDSVKITANPTPKARFYIYSPEQCLKGNSFTISNYSTIAGGTIVTNRWDFGDHIFLFSKNAIHSFKTDDTFHIKLTVTANDGCADSNIQNAIVLPQPDPDFSISQAGQCLKNNFFVFTNNSSVSNGSIIDNSWHFGDGSGNHNTNNSHNYLTDDTFYVKLAVTSDQKCSDSVIKQVFVFPQPKAGFTVNDSSQCLKNNSFVFLNTSSLKSGGMAFHWVPGDSITSNNINFTHSYPSTGYYYPILIVTSDKGCADTSVKTVNVKPNPVINLGKDTTLFAGQSIILDAGLGFDKYLWSTGSPNQKLYIDSTGTGLHSKLFWVVVTKNGCLGSDTIKITFMQKVGIDNLLKNTDIKVYPNPCTALLNIDIEGVNDKTYFSLNNNQGDEIIKMSLNPRQGKIIKQIDVSMLPEGTYFLKISNGDFTKVIKIFKTN